MANQQYQRRFIPRAYLNADYKHPGQSQMRDFALHNIHEFFKTKSTSILSDKPQYLKVLDYGCGPVIAHSISAAGIGSAVEIVLADFTDECRKAVQQWLDKDPLAWDWSPYIKYVVHTLEGKQDHQEAALREESLRKAIKAVVPCDITKDSPIAEGFEGPYDVVISILCLENACETKEEVKAAIKRISALVKPGGNLLINIALQSKETCGFFHIAETKFTYVGISLQFLLYALEESGFTEIAFNLLPKDILEKTRIVDNTNDEGMVFITAMRKLPQTS